MSRRRVCTGGCRRPRGWPDRMPDSLVGPTNLASEDGPERGAAANRELEDELCLLAGGPRSGGWWATVRHRSRCTSSPTTASRRSRPGATASAPSPRRVRVETTTAIVSVRPAQHQLEQIRPSASRTAAPAEVREGRSIDVDLLGPRGEVRVVLAENEREYTGYAEGSVASMARRPSWWPRPRSNAIAPG